MKRVLLWIIPVIVFSTSVWSPVGAQEAERTPAYLALSGDLFTWTPGDNAVQPFTACDLGGDKILSLSLSPLGSHLAMNVVPEEVFTGGYAPTPTGNLWICDLRNASMQAITGVDVLSETISREAVWSPDGTRIAWGKPNEDQITAAIYVYNLASGTISTLVSSTPLDYGCGVGPIPPAMAWTESGLAVGHFIGQEADPCTSESAGIYVYDSEGQQIADLPVGRANDMNGIGQVLWDSEVIGRLIYSQSPTGGDWNTVSLTEGSALPASGVPQQFVPSAAQDSPTLTWITGEDGILYPRAALPGLSQPFEPSLSVDAFNIGFSPDGRAAVFQIESLVYGVVDGVIQPLDLGVVTRDPDDSSLFSLGNDIAWAPTQIRLAPPMSVAFNVCSDVERLYYPDDRAVVISGMGPNNIRSVPLPDAELLGEIPEGETAEAPFWTDVCSGGIRWRYVTYNGVSGWTAESERSTTYLEPAS